MTDLLLPLARRVSAAEREHRGKAEDLWRLGDVVPALRYRSIADGLAEARDIHARVVAEHRAGTLERDPLDAAMHSVWLHGEWRALTTKMTVEEREAAADAVQRYSNHLAAQDDHLSGPIRDLRWWR